MFPIESAKDSPPTIEVISPGEREKIVFGNQVKMIINATDDYGLLEVSIFHKEGGGPADSYHKEVVARFPKGNKRFYSS